MSTISIVFLSGLSLVFAILGLSMMFTSVRGGACFILAAAIMFPPITDFLREKFSFQQKTKHKTYSIIALIFIGLTLSIADSEEKEKARAKAAEEHRKEMAVHAKKIEQENRVMYFRQNKEQIMGELNKGLQEKDYKSIISKAEEFLSSGDLDVVNIYKRASESQAIIEKEEKTREILKKLKTLPSEQLDANRDLYQQLVSMHPQNQNYKEKLNFYNTKINQEIQEQAKTEERNKKIAAQFHPWDGSHIQLEKLIKKAMNDPDSYEHVESGYIDNGDSVIVQTTYRGKNAFGGVVKNFVRARVNLDGDIIEIIDES